MTAGNLNHIAFLDIEASGLGPDSWPIEIGVAWLDWRKVITHSSLIRPRPEWPEDAWIPESALVHGIDRAELDDAPQADEVARWFRQLIGDRILISDAPEYDAMWLARLLGERREILLLQAALHRAFSVAEGGVAPGRLHKAYKLRGSQKPAHRAGDDAAGHAHVWRAALVK